MRCITVPREASLEGAQSRIRTVVRIAEYRPGAKLGGGGGFEAAPFRQNLQVLSQTGYPSGCGMRDMGGSLTLGERENAHTPTHAKKK